MPNDPQHILVRDFETRSAASLKLCGAWRYAADPTTEVLCVGFAVDDGPVQMWIPGQPVPAQFHTAATDPAWRVVAHNDQFESAIEQRVLAPRYDWPLVPIERHICTMATALAAALPGALENAAAALGLPYQKDRDGRLTMMQLSRSTGNIDPKKRERLTVYCANDVDVERSLHQRLPPLSADEQILWQLDALINARGFHVDRRLAEAARAMVREEQQDINATISTLTEGAVTTPDQVKRIKAFVNARGHALKSLSKRSVSAVLAHDPGEAVRQILELRRSGSRASVRKLNALLIGSDADDRLRGTLRFHGAATGRWSGSGFQPQNLKKPDGDAPSAA